MYLNTEKNLELDVLYRISHVMVHQSYNLSEFLNEVLNILAKRMSLFNGILTLKKIDSDIFVIEAAHSLTIQEKNRGLYNMGEGIIGQVAKSGRAFFTSDITKEKSFLNKTGSREMKQIAFICVPIVYQKKVIGTLSVDSKNSNEDFLAKNLHFLKLVANLIAESVASIREQIAKREALKQENIKLKQQLFDYYQPKNIIGHSSSMRYVYEQIMQVADSNATVLIRGESGTGKELVARAIHLNSSIKNNAFVGINCGAIPENLVESELFGHEKGAFTGAYQKRKGRFEQANGGSLFLDEIGEISLNVQASLLRVLQEKSFERVGSEKTLKVNVRIIAATSKNLEKAIQNGGFREDLYYRLNVFPIHLPALRERKSDIIPLADHFIQHYNRLYKKNIKRLSTSAINMMMDYHWPGNVRELENCIERAVITSKDEVIYGFSLPPSLQTGDHSNTSFLPLDKADKISLFDMVSSYEREIITDALKKKQGNIASTARLLNTTQRILHYKIKKLNVDIQNYKN